MGGWGGLTRLRHQKSVREEISSWVTYGDWGSRRTPSIKEFAYEARAGKMKK